MKKRNKISPNKILEHFEKTLTEYEDEDEVE